MKDLRTDLIIRLYRTMPGAPMPKTDGGVCLWGEVEGNQHWDFCECIIDAILAADALRSVQVPVWRGDADLPDIPVSEAPREAGENIPGTEEWLNAAQEIFKMLDITIGEKDGQLASAARIKALSQVCEIIQPLVGRANRAYLPKPRHSGPPKGSVE